MSASELLAQTLATDGPTRQNAEAKLEAAARENYPAYVQMLVSELANESGSLETRGPAGAALKNSLSAREAARQQEYSNRWLALDAETRNQVKQQTLQTLGSSTQRAGSMAAMVIAAIAAIELPQLQWNDLIDILLGFIQNSPEHVNLRISTLQTIGFICEQIKPEILSEKSNQILTAVVQGARKEETSSQVQLVALHALLNSLEFIRDNFERDGERNYIMQVVCEATQNPEVDVQSAAFEVLVRIMGLYYDKMSFYMERALFGLTVMGMKSTEEKVALQAIEFWSTVCEEETELLVDALDAAEFGESPETESRHFAKIALPEIVPVLLTLLTRQDEDADEDEWNVSMAAGTCLSLLASAVQDAIVPAVIPFIEANIRNNDWHYREAAVMTFGSILDGPDPSVLAPLVNQALPLLIDMMADPHVHVKDTTAWTLGRVSDLLIQCIKPDVHLHPLITALVNGLTDSPRIIANSCWAIMNLADQLGNFNEDENQAVPPTAGPLSPYYQGIVEALLKVTETTSNESNYRTSAYEAITSLVTNAPPDAIPIVQNTSLTILQRMEHLISVQNQIVGSDDRNNWNDLISNFCSVIISVTRKLGQGIQPLAERIMTIILHLIQAAGKTTTILEDAFLVVGTLAASLEQGFQPYVGAFLPFLHPALKAHEDSQLCTVAVGLIGDIVRAIGDQSSQYAGAFMNVLIENLQSDVLNRNVKISVLSCFGDIALAIGGEFEPYFDTAMDVLLQAGRVQPNPLDYDLIEYVAQLREGILEAYTGIVTGLKTTPKAALLLPRVPEILDLVNRSLSDEERTEAVVRLGFGLVGDLAETFANGQIKQFLLAEWVGQQLRSKARMSPDTKRTARWARELVKRATA